MRILILHSRYLSGAASGENSVVDDEIALLRNAGHDVQAWTPSPDVEGIGGLLTTGAGAIWSRKAASEVTRRIEEHRAEVVHCHNLFSALSPSVLRAASASDAALVMTLHNYRLLCLPAIFLRDGKTCELCLGKVPWRGVVFKCYRDSAAKSLALASSLTIHRAAKSFDKVDLYLPVSRFVRDKYVDAGWSVERMFVKPNFAWSTEEQHHARDYFLFLGRLSVEKGLDALVSSWDQAPGKLVIVGSGPEEAKLRRLARGDVEFRGPVESAEALRMLSRARALVIPSVCFEGAPRSLVEAYAAGVPVMGSRIGALPEFIRDGTTGVLLPPADGPVWAQAAAALMDDDRCTRLGAGARREWELRYSPERAVTDLETAYTHAIASR